METKINYLLDSLLIQSCRDFKVFVINDGSKDNSEKVILDYEPKFKNYGIPFYYFSKNNEGVAATVNYGLNKVDTEYFCLPDADDYLSKDYIKQCKYCLDNNRDFGIVFVQCRVFHECYRDKQVALWARSDKYELSRQELIDSFIWELNFFYGPSYMVRTQSFLNANGSMSIFCNTKGGQNPQIIFPLLMESKVGYIQSPLYNYIIYKNSHSHFIKNSYDKIIERLERDRILWITVISGLHAGNTQKKAYLNIKENVMLLKKARVSYDYGRIEDLRTFCANIDDKLIPSEYKLLTEGYSIKNVLKIFFHSKLCSIKRIIKDSQFRFLFQAICYKLRKK